MSAMDHRQYMRAYRLPEMIKRAEEKLARLYAEEQGVAPTLSDMTFFHEAWERTIKLEKLKAEGRGEESSMGFDHA